VLGERHLWFPHLGAERKRVQQDERPARAAMAIALGTAGVGFQVS